MALLTAKKILVTGVLSNRSIAYGIAKAARREGAEIALTYQNERFKDRVTDMAKELGSPLALPCEVTSDAEIESLFGEIRKNWGGLDGLVHAIAFAPREAIAGDFLDGVSREAFRQAHDISVYSFPALAKAALPLLSKNASLLTLTYLGAARVVPNYNTMGLAKASLEASVRYLAASLGPRGIRVNGISAGPIKTLAAARSESRKAAALPTSSVVTLRLSGACSSTNLRILPKPEMPAAARVLIGPAEMPFTRMPLAPRFAAR